MKVGIIGSGIVGRVLGAGFLKYGHQVMIGTRDVDKSDLQQWIRETPGAKVGSFEEAARFGEMIVLVTLGRALESVIAQAALGLATSRVKRSSMLPTRFQTLHR